MKQDLITEFKNRLSDRKFPCVGARAAWQKEQLTGFQAGHLGCPRDDREILKFLYQFVDHYREKEETLFHSAFVIFETYGLTGPEEFEPLFWQRIQAIADLDAQQFPYDDRVSKDPQDSRFSFSIKSEAFFIVTLYPGASRKARQFPHPVIIFNPHQQFQQLKEDGRFEKMKQIIRKRDNHFSGSVNPLLEDYGQRSEIYQYTGILHDDSWKCPLHLKHAAS